MTYTISTTASFLARTEPFDRLSPQTLTQLAQAAQYYRYREGQPIALADRLSDQINIVVEGMVRLLGNLGEHALPITLERLTTGMTIGIVGVIRGVPCETAIASTETICLTIPTELFLQVLAKETILKQYFGDRPSLIEIFEVLRLELTRSPHPDRRLRQLGADSLVDLAIVAKERAVVYDLPRQISPDLMDWDWFVASQQPTLPWQIGDRLDRDGWQANQHLRSIGIAPDILKLKLAEAIDEAIDIDDPIEIPNSFDLSIGPPHDIPNSFDLSIGPPRDIPYAPDLPLARAVQTPGRERYPIVRGRGQIDGSVACFEMVAKQLKTPFRRDTVSKVVKHHFDRSGGISLQFCGAVVDLLGLQGQLAAISIADLPRIQVPALIKWQDRLAVVCAATDRSVTILLPESGAIQRSPQELLLNQEWATETTTADAPIPILLIQATCYTPTQKFGIGWF
jgi:Cyclic nucleotide-binding domain